MSPMHEIEFTLGKFSWGHWSMVFLVGAVLGIVVAVALGHIRSRRTQLTVGAIVLVVGVAAGVIFAIPESMLAGLELPLILFGLSLLIWRYPEKENRTPPNQAFEAMV
jgi:hypothetical protein